MKLRIPTAACLALLALSACRNKGHSDNPDVAAGYRGNNQYEGEIVTAEKRQDYGDQGQSISPKTLQNIEDTISNVYEKDFARCLEEQMDELGTRFVRSVFTAEFTIDTSGAASKAKVLEIETRTQKPNGADIGQVSSEGMKACIQSSIAEWQFDPPPEAVYIHTYRGQVGEAF